MNNILVVRRPPYLNLGSFSNPHTSSRRHGSQLPPPLDKYVTSADEDVDKKGVIRLPSLYNTPRDASYISHRTIDNHLKELQVFNCFMLNILDHLYYVRYDCVFHIVNSMYCS